MEDEVWKALGWSFLSIFSGLGAAVSVHPWPRLFFALGAVGAGVKAVESFQKVAENSYAQLISPKRYLELPSVR